MKKLNFITSYLYILYELKMWKNEFPKSSAHLEGYAIGTKAYMMGDFKGAVKVFTKLTNLEPNVSISWGVLLESLSHLGKWEEMIKLGTTALELHPKYGPIYACVGDAYSKLAKGSKATKYYKKGLKLLEKDLVKYPTDEHILNLIGEINIRLGNYEEAIKFSKNASNINPKSEHHLHSLGLAYKEMGQYEKAIAYFERSLDVNPKHSYAWFDLGLIYENLNNSKKAIECFEKAVEYSPQWVKLREKLVEVKPDSLALLKKPPDIRASLNEKFAREYAQSESLFVELTDIIKQLEESELTEEEKKYYNQRKLDLIKEIERDLVPREEKLAELKKLLAESIELSIKINNESNKKKKDELYTQLRDLAKLVENKRVEIYKTKKSYEEVTTTYYMELGPKDARTLWENMKMSTTDYNEFMDLMRQETDFLKEMIAIADESFKKAEKFDEYRPKGII
ncbi:MAG: tetratricopeptide repeat protein, partial [Candidatus Lokiarchaeota archaeon]|nr:tetratricopeptide repeat protein [Candidatus Lokiarchaeota archaeon]